jgi:hypothetical protein
MRSSDELLDEAAWMTLAMEDRDIRNEADRKWLRVNRQRCFQAAKSILWIASLSGLYNSRPNVRG